MPGIKNKVTVDQKKGLAYFIAMALSLFILAMGAKIFFPFLKPLAWAIIIVLFLYPFYSWLKKTLKNRRILSAALMCMLVVAFVIVPAFFLLSALAEEFIKAYNHLKELVESHQATEMIKGLAWLDEKILKHFPAINLGAKDILSATLGRAGDFLVQQGTLIFKNILQFIIGLVFTLVIIYYLFKDGDTFLVAVQELLPLSKTDIEAFTERIYNVLIATLRGSFFTALIQGALGSLMFWILGFSTPILWGSLMAISAFIPILGTSIVWLPATGYLFAQGFIAKALILLVFGALVISQIDYFLRPILISGRAKLHNLLLFFSIIGGLWNFGLVGIFLGPILVSLAVGILEIYKLKVLEREI